MANCNTNNKIDLYKFWTKVRLGYRLQYEKSVMQESKKRLLPNNIKTEYQRIDILPHAAMSLFFCFPDACVWGKHSARKSTAKWRRPPRTVPALTPGHDRAEALQQRRYPLFIERRNILGRSQTETITIRVTPEEKLTMQGKMYEAVAPSMREFVLRMCVDGKIVVNSDLRALNQELRYQGNNLNQLTKLCHQGRISAVDHSELLSVYLQILLALGGENDGDY